MRVSCLFSPKAMAVLTDHPYASLTLPDDAAADCLFLRPGQPGLPPFLLHRGGGDLPNSQEVREGRSSTTTPQPEKWGSGLPCANVLTAPHPWDLGPCIALGGQEAAGASRRHPGEEAKSLGEGGEPGAV